MSFFAQTRLCAAGVALAALVGCDSQRNTIVVVTAKLSTPALAGSLFALKTTVEDSGRLTTHDFAPGTGQSISFPVSFSIEIDRNVTGPVALQVQAFDRTGRVRAHGMNEKIDLMPGKSHQVEIALLCLEDCPARDDDGPSNVVDEGTMPHFDGQPTCGNGQIDPGETCDTAIAAGRPGACPGSSCNDGVACTTDTRTGLGCALTCTHTEIQTPVASDGCCPADATWQIDLDCSRTCGNGTIEAGETCDTGITAGMPGACPTATDCEDDDACTIDVLVSANTCSARCLQYTIHARVPGDKCCPANATHATDPDCPIVCGNGRLDPGEACDTGIKAGNMGACPMQCNDNDSCTTDVLLGSRCQARCVFTPITTITAGDGCCLPGHNANIDPDCAPVCGNGVVEPGEICDRAIALGLPGACPTACAAAGCQGLSLIGDAANCSARCEAIPITTCDATTPDGCCPDGCTTTSDVDCSGTCGNGTRETKETCDTAAPVGSANACPTLITCANDDPCTMDHLEAPGTCHARCTSTQITRFISGDSCCPTWANHNVDADCGVVCGNGLVEHGKESCDRAIPAGMPGACPTGCPIATEWCMRYELQGNADQCTAVCAAIPTQACQSNDGCCPEGCNANNDNDCAAVCGNGVVEPGEACDKAITAGHEGWCPAVCNDDNSCTLEVTAGSIDDCTRICRHRTISACAAGDGCCPAGCDALTDGDCVPQCGNGVVEHGEFCDPPTSCPTRCDDDGDPCTKTQLWGDPVQCTARCRSVPITECGPVSDGCCPNGCLLNDPDCAASPVK